MKRKILSIISITIILATSLEVVSANYSIENLSPIIENHRNTYDDRLFDLKVKLLMRLGHFPSISAGIIKNDGVIWYKGYGKAKFLTKPTINTVYNLGSISKTFIGTAMMQLYEKELFDLDDDVNDYLDFEVRNPDYPNIPITFRMLLAHQSSVKGLDVDGPVLKFFTDLFSMWCFFRYNDDYPYSLIKKYFTSDSNFVKTMAWNNYPPGEGGYYSNICYMLLEHLVEVLSGKPFTEYCQENIFNPLNMENTSFYPKDFKRNQLANIYHNVGNFFIRIPYFETPYGVGGLKSSIEDLSHYTIAHMSGGVWHGVRILKESTIEEMHRDQYPDFVDAFQRYGLGWMNWTEYKEMDLQGHGGHIIGGTSHIWINASNDFAILMFINNKVDYKNKIVFESFNSLIETFYTKAKNL